MDVDAGKDSDAEARKELGDVTEKLQKVADFVGPEFDDLRGKLRARQTSLRGQITRGKSLDTRLKEMSVQHT
eukprot:5342701-Pyramimonas_sp.AAC.1